ncbi:hypothetical protein LguiB_002939 [Lonicera macranthoides]
MEINTNPFYLFFFLSPYLLLFANSIPEGFKYEEEGIQRSQFPSGFLFGTATSAYQIEGAYLEDGKTLTNWDVFSRTRGSIKNEDNGYVCDDHYHRYLEDIEIMHSLGVNAYRFSISWARVLPRGRFGGVNPIGIMFYNNIIDNLLLKGIKPFVTIHHHDFPQELEERYGSWLSPLMQEDFALFAETCFKSFGDRVKYWATINEPNLFADFAYERGLYPPAHCSPPFGNCSTGNSDVEPLIAMHNMLLAHGKAAKLYRESFQPKQGGSIGIVVHSFMYEPLTNNEVDKEAANRALAFNVAWAIDPLIFGDYPPEMRRYHGSELPRFSPEETEYIKGSVDFLGINHYSTLYAKDCIYSTCVSIASRAIRGFVYTTGERDGVPIGMGNFYVVPRGMGEIIEYVKKRYHNKPMFLTENGYASSEKQEVQLQDALHDVKRIEFHKAHLSSLAQAIRSGADVRGYFAWTLMDDFEWNNGYGTRFGLYYVEPRTLNRIPKSSALWFKSFLTSSSSLIGRIPSKNGNIIVSETMDPRAEM